MPSPVVVSVIALAISFVSLGLSSYLAWRDRSRVHAECFARQHEGTGEYSSVFVTVTNAGRRSVILRTLVGIYEDSSRGGQQLGQSGIKLGEGEFHELEFGKFDGIMINGDDMPSLVDLLFEDSAGKKHKINSSRKNIKLLRESKHPLGVRTHG